MTDYGHVAVLMGGWSAEREVSLVSGNCAHKALQKRGVKATAVDLQREDLPELAQKKFARCFMALHGTGGEDGEVQQALDAMAIPYSGSGASASRTCMDKMATKRLWKDINLPTPKAVLADPDQLEAQVEMLGMPMIAKPLEQGSSIGVEIIRQPEEVPAAVERSLQYGGVVMLERLIDGTEYTVGILQGQTLPIIRLRPANEFFDYEAKYESSETGYDIPCGLPEPMESELQSLALRAFECTGAHGYGRVDLMLDEWERPWLLEVNTAPGLTHHSLLPMAAEAAGIEYEDLVVRMLDTSFVELESQEAVNA